MNAAEVERIKEILPTTLGSAELRSRVSAEILRRSIFSARMANAYYLARLRDICTLVSNGTISHSEARYRLLVILEHLGYSAQDGGGIQNPASLRRLDLILDTQRQMAASVARLMSENDAIRAQFPAWELVRVERRMIPRIDWPSRWRNAATTVNFEGVVRNSTRFVALKSSPVWQALGDGAGGFKDVLFNPYPPFAYSSGMGWRAVPREECAALGLVAEEVPAPKEATLDPGDKEILEAIRRYGLPKIAEGIE